MLPTLLDVEFMMLPMLHMCLPLLLMLVPTCVPMSSVVVWPMAVLVGLLLQLKLPSLLANAPACNLADYAAAGEVLYLLPSVLPVLLLLLMLAKGA